MSANEEISAPIDALIAARSGAGVAPVAKAFAVECLRRSLALEVQQTTKAPSYFRVVYDGMTVAYVRPRRGTVRIEFGIPYKGRRDVGFGIDGAFGPTYALDLVDLGGIPGAIAMLDEAIRLAPTLH